MSDGNSFRTSSSSDNLVGLYHSNDSFSLDPSDQDRESFPQEPVPGQAFPVLWHIFNSSISVTLSAKDLKASRIGLYPVHLQQMTQEIK